jgi:pilus assembly protein CpaE
VLNRADAKVGLRPVDAAEAVGLPIEAMIDSAREIPLSMNVGTPVVKLEPRSAVAKQMSQLTHLFAPIDLDRPRRRWFRRAR